MLKRKGPVNSKAPVKFRTQDIRGKGRVPRTLLEVRAVRRKDRITSIRINPLTQVAVLKITLPIIKQQEATNPNLPEIAPKAEAVGKE
jgi:hypothetical protein